MYHLRRVSNAQVFMHHGQWSGLDWKMLALHPEQRPFLNRVFSDILIVNCLTAADQCPFAAVLPPIEQRGEVYSLEER